jgi:hypothetical protein
MHITEFELADIFEEWERKYRENPDAFMGDEERRAENPQTYGELCAAFFLKVRTGLLEKKLGDRVCGRTIAPKGWWCSRKRGHEGPCAAHPVLES